MKRSFLLILFMVAFCRAQSNENRVPPVAKSEGYSHTYRYSLAINAYKFSENGFKLGEAITTIPAQKGTDLHYVGNASPLLGMPVYCKEGSILMENEAAIGYRVTLADEPKSKELWMVLAQPDLFNYEAYMNMYDLPYLGVFGGNKGLRLKASAENANDGWQYPNAPIPTNQVFIIRYQVLSTDLRPKVIVSVNNIVLGSALTTMPVKSNRIGFGTDGANCPLYTPYELLDMPPLTAVQAGKVYNELASAYNIGKVIPEPYADHVVLLRTARSTAVKYIYHNPLGFPENVSKRVIRWIDGTPKSTPNYFNPTAAVYIHKYDNQTTIPIVTACRVEITVTDIKGNSRTLPASSYIN